MPKNIHTILKDLMSNNFRQFKTMCINGVTANPVDDEYNGICQYIIQLKNAGVIFHYIRGNKVNVMVIAEGTVLFTQSISNETYKKSAQLLYAVSEIINLHHTDIKKMVEEIKKVFE